MMVKNIRIIFDLDYTLLDTLMFKKQLFNILSSSGASMEDILSSYVICTDDELGEYEFETHLNLLNKMASSFKQSDAIDKFNKFRKSDFSKFLYDGALEILITFKEKGYCMVMVTKGSCTFQELKINQSGIGAFFNEVHICQGSKLPVYKKIKPKPGDVVVNDNWKEICEVKNIYPSLKYFFSMRSDFKEVKNSPCGNVRKILSIKDLLSYSF